ncbi:hypothetical protein [Streptomyces tsukubensis]|uniref:hypothetical protein n=1 Tax=Streptomyces tsukubensis TaxID=83656 RepID=UPI00344CD312
MNPTYWTIVMQRAAVYSLAQEHPGAFADGRAPDPRGARRGLRGGPHAPIVFEDCPDHLRTPAGIPDIDRLVPLDADALTVLTTAEQQRPLFGRGLDEELRNVEDQVAGTVRARATVQQVLDQVPHGTAGRKRMLDLFHEMRDGPRAIAGVIGLTTAALHEVAAQ